MRISSLLVFASLSGCASPATKSAPVVDAGRTDAIVDVGLTKPSSMSASGTCAGEKFEIACDTAALASTRRVYKDGDITFYEVYCYAKPPASAPFVHVRVSEGEGGDYTFPHPSFEKGLVLLEFGCRDGRSMQVGFGNTRSAKANLVAEKKHAAGDFEGVFAPASVSLGEGEAKGEFDVDFSDR